VKNTVKLGRNNTDPEPVIVAPTSAAGIPLIRTVLGDATIVSGCAGKGGMGRICGSDTSPPLWAKLPLIFTLVEYPVPGVLNVSGV
tara:strand:- start:1278 stop:1535 length:258 start_codon:yes stop_codon:yes gene_type:complete